MRESQTVEILKVKFNMKLAITIRTGAATAERPEEIQKVSARERKKLRKSVPREMPMHTDTESARECKGECVRVRRGERE